MSHLNFTANDLIRDARAQAGLTDFGDERWMPAFRKMVEGLEREMPMSPEGQKMSRARFLRLLVNRLRATADIKAHPEILDEVIAPPLIVLGLPRTGSTKLQRMLGAADQVRSLLMWHGYNVAPFPDAKPGEEDPRIADAAEFLAWRAAKHTSISKAHHAAAKEPEEELYLVEMSFTNWAVGGYYFCPTYLDWLRTVDRDYVYDYVRLMLQYVQWQHHRGAAPRRWILKTPPNLGFEADMLKAFPDAHFVMLHRDLMNVVPSWISLSHSMMHQYAADVPSKPEVADWHLTECDDVLRRHLAWRDANPDAPILDVAYEELLNDDMAVVRRIYDFAGMELTPEAEAAMQAWSDENGQHRHGEHVYSLADAAITEADIYRSNTAAYARRFGHLMKPAGA